MRVHYHGRAMRLEAARRHGILVMLRLRLRLMVGIVPLRHLLVVGRRVRRGIMLRVVVRVVGVRVVNGRVRLWRKMIVLMVDLPSPGMGRHGRRVRAWHHGDGRAVAFTRGRRPQTKQPL